MMALGQSSRTNDSWSKHNDSWSTISYNSSSLGRNVEQSTSTTVTPSSAAQHQYLARPNQPAQYPSSTAVSHQKSTSTVQSFEIDEATTSSGGMSWSKRVPWLRSSHSDRQVGLPDSLEYSKDGATFYYGGEMETENHTPRISITSGSHPEHAPAKRPAAVMDTMQHTSSFKRIASWLTRSSHNTNLDEDSLADFDESEWTPPDSSYGAAIPVGGWIPKNTRRGIEATLIGLMVICLVYLVVTTSIHVTEDGSHRKNETDSDYGGIDLDDDRYIEYSHDDYAVKQAYYDDAVNNNDDQSDDVVQDDDAANDDGQRRQAFLLL